MVPIPSECHEPNQDFSITSPTKPGARRKHLLLTRGLSHHRCVRAPRCTGSIDSCAKMSFDPQAVARRENQCAAQCPGQRPRTSLLSCKWVAQGVTRVPKTLHAWALTGDQVAEMQNNSETTDRFFLNTGPEGLESNSRGTHAAVELSTKMQPSQRPLQMTNPWNLPVAWR